MFVSISIFFAQVIGLYFTVMAIAMLKDSERVLKFAKDFMTESALFFFSGIFTLILGILMVTMHNIWMGDWTILITILCWLTFIKGILLVLFPKMAIDWGRKMQKSLDIRYSGIIYLLIGLFLLWKGFF